jgi:hypothetical protein
MGRRCSSRRRSSCTRSGYERDSSTTSFEGLASGVRQVVLLGAGFDTRGLRLPEIAACQASVYEVDFAEQLEKERAHLCPNASIMQMGVAEV